MPLGTLQNMNSEKDKLDDFMCLAIVKKDSSEQKEGVALSSHAPFKANPVCLFTSCRCVYALLHCVQ